MTDPGWLRFLGGNRSRNSRTLTSPRSEPVLRLPHHTNQVVDEAHAHHRKAISRLSSWHGLMRPTSMPTGVDDDQANNVVGEEKMAWHNPSIDQVVDALRVAMMTKSVLDPLSNTYHSHIMRLIEGYSLVQENFKVVQQELVSMEVLRQEELEAYRAKQEDWMIREARYKAEIKRLELVIHQTSDNGLEAVALARSGSLLRPMKHTFTKLEVSRPRKVDVNSDVRLSRRLRSQENAHTQGQNRARGRGKRPDIRTKACQDTSGSGSSGAGCISLHGDVESNNEADNARPSPDGRVCPQLPYRSASQRFGPEEKASRTRHRREFSFAPGDDMSTIPSLSTANTTPRDLDNFVETRATFSRSHGRVWGDGRRRGDW
ncbi:hypothetical protein EDB81DRAFT_758002 [Dactylonectria macrodidyma]|uniref:Uncharacterized protein n=1 Tax=Dactylonectria macrodidyma TaxID=307937 RepID=A0A9P9J837_9HYPO|nr:hypothetical protein EDB81DRAFT_758002 [Dactylonectria macrodidyma]